MGTNRVFRRNVVIVATAHLLVILAFILVSRWTPMPREREEVTWLDGGGLAAAAGQ